MALHGHVDAISRSVIEGWAIDTDHPEEAVSIAILVNGAHRGMCLTTHARTDLVLPNGVTIAGKWGFYFTFDPPLSPFIEHRIDVVETWSAEPLPNGSRTLPRPRTHIDDGARIRPILLTSTGRTGTTLLMSEFARHAAIVVGDQYPYEIKQIAYHAAAFRALAADADWQRSTTPDTMMAPEMQRIIGSNPYNMAGLFGLGGGEGALREFYQSTVPSGLATLFRRFIVTFYTTLAGAQGKAGVPYFCEKGEIDEAAVHGARLFFDAVKDIVIVRDPRDLLCSAIAFWKLRPDAAMNMLATTVPRLARIARLAGPDTVVIRYEDLVREPVPTRQTLSRFLDLDLVTWPAARAEPVPDSHRTSADPAASIGRWRNDLTAEQTEACEWAFGAYMRDFGYEPSVSPNRGDRSRSGARYDRRPEGRPEAERAASRRRIVAAEGVIAVADFNDTSLAESESGVASRQVLELEFGRGGTGEAATLAGWSPPERGFVWSNATESVLQLPPVRREGTYRLHLTVTPFTHGTALPAQRVTVMLDGRIVGSARVRDICVLRVPLPRAVSRFGRAITLTLRFPDARRPSEIFGGSDSRLLGFSLHRIGLFRADTDLSTARATPSGPDRAHPTPGGHTAPPGLTEPRPNGSARRSEAPKDWDRPFVSRVIQMARAAFTQPDLEFHALATLRDIPGYDAIRFVQLILAIETEFGITLRENEVDAIVTMGDIVTLLGGRIVEGEWTPASPAAVAPSDRADPVPLEAVPHAAAETPKPRPSFRRKSPVPNASLARSIE